MNYLVDGDYSPVWYGAHGEHIKCPLIKQAVCNSARSRVPVEVLFGLDVEDYIAGVWRVSLPSQREHRANKQQSPAAKEPLRNISVVLFESIFGIDGCDLGDHKPTLQPPTSSAAAGLLPPTKEKNEKEEKPHSWLELERMLESMPEWDFEEPEAAPQEEVKIQEDAQLTQQSITSPLNTTLQIPNKPEDAPLPMPDILHSSIAMQDLSESSGPPTATITNPQPDPLQALQSMTTQTHKVSHAFKKNSITSPPFVGHGLHPKPWSRHFQHVDKQDMQLGRDKHPLVPKIYSAPVYSCTSKAAISGTSLNQASYHNRVATSLASNRYTKTKSRASTKLNTRDPQSLIEEPTTSDMTRETQMSSSSKKSYSVGAATTKHSPTHRMLCTLSKPAPSPPKRKHLVASQRILNSSKVGTLPATHAIGDLHPQSLPLQSLPTKKPILHRISEYLLIRRTKSGIPRLAKGHVFSPRSEPLPHHANNTRDGSVSPSRLPTPRKSKQSGGSRDTPQVQDQLDGANKYVSRILPKNRKERGHTTRPSEAAAENPASPSTYPTPKDLRAARRSYRQSEDFLGPAGANPRTGLVDTVQTITSTEESECRRRKLRSSSTGTIIKRNNTRRLFSEPFLERPLVVDACISTTTIITTTTGPRPFHLLPVCNTTNSFPDDDVTATATFEACMAVLAGLCFFAVFGTGRNYPSCLSAWHG